jgi:hypothetical protein
MRRILFTVLASCVVLVAVPAIATARHDEHHRGRHHRHARHHHREHVRRHDRARVRVRHFDSSHTNSSDNPGEQGTAGTVTSFTGNVLTITLNNGDVVKGEVTQETELRCEMAENEFQDEDQGPGGDDNNGDGPGSGDDQGEDNDDQMCATVAPGMTVDKAELRITSAGAFWEEVELSS